MGWTSLHREPGTTDRQFFEQEFPHTLTRNGKIVACATVAFTFYAAVKQRDTGEVWCLVVLTQRSRDYFNFSYKEMSDSSGPGEYRCPVKVLDALTHTDSEYANDWRARCREYHAKRSDARQVKAGTTIKLASPVPFTNGCEYDTFRYMGEGSAFSAISEGRTVAQVSLRGWRDRAFKIVT